MALQSKTIIITGCTKGIGLAIAELFASNGYQVGGCARNTNDLEKLRIRFEVMYPGRKFLLKTIDVTDKKALLAFASDCLKHFNTIDILVNNAGVFIPGNLMDEEDGVIEKLMDTNVLSAYHLTRALLPVFLKHKRGYIFNMCSVASLKAYPRGASYCISKFAMLGFTKQLREDLKLDNIKVTAIIPGATLTNSWEGTELPDELFMAAEDVAKTIYNISLLSNSTDIEEVIMRPQLGDI